LPQPAVRALTAETPNGSILLGFLVFREFVHDKVQLKANGSLLPVFEIQCHFSNIDAMSLALIFLVLSRSQSNDYAHTDSASIK
jgi:hypothetical protein